MFRFHAVRSFIFSSSSSHCCYMKEYCMSRILVLYLWWWYDSTTQRLRHERLQKRDCTDDLGFFFICNFLWKNMNDIEARKCLLCMRYYGYWTLTGWMVLAYLPFHCRSLILFLRPISSIIAYKMGSMRSMIRDPSLSEKHSLIHSSDKSIRSDESIVLLLYMWTIVIERLNDNKWFCQLPR